MKRLKRFLFGYSVDLLVGGIIYRYKGVHGWEFGQRCHRDGILFEVVYFQGRSGNCIISVRLDHIDGIGGELAEHPDFFKRPWCVEEPESEESRIKRFLTLKGITGTNADDPKMGQF